MAYRMGVLLSTYLSEESKATEGDALAEYLCALSQPWLTSEHLQRDGQEQTYYIHWWC